MPHRESLGSLPYLGFMVDRIPLVQAVLRVKSNSIYPDAGYPDRLGPSAKHFLTVTVLTYSMVQSPS